MSNHLISMVYKREVGSLIRKSVLVLMADKASDDGSGIFASKQTMADELCCSRRAVFEAIDSLKTDGLISEIGTRPNNFGYTVEYQINFTPVEELPLVPCHLKRWCAQRTSAGGALVQEVHPTSAGGAPKPSIKPTPSGAKAPSVERGRTIDDLKKVEVHALRSECVKWAINEMSWPAFDANFEFNKFIDSAQAHGRRYRNWLAAWRSWCRSPYCKTTSPEAAATAYRKEPLRV